MTERVLGVKVRNLQDSQTQEKKKKSLGSGVRTGTWGWEERLSKRE